MAYVESYLPSSTSSPPRRRRNPPAPPVTTVTAATGSSSSGSSAYPAPVPSTVPVSQNTERPVGVTTRGTTTTDPLEQLLAGEPVGGGRTLERLLQVGEASETPERRIVAQLRRVARKSQGGLAAELNRGFDPGETITPFEAAVVAEAHGLPGITYSRAIVPGESGYQPGVRNPDDQTPSLFQITPSVQSAETQAKFNRIAAKHPGGYSNPIAAAKQARVLARGSSDAGVSNYVAFDPSAPQGHLPGGQQRARRLLYGDPEPIPQDVRQQAEQALGPKRTQEIIREARNPSSLGPRPLSIAELYHDPGVNVSDGQPTGPIGGHGTHVHFASESPRDILRAAAIAQRRDLEVRENPLFDPVDPVHTAGSHHDQASELPQRLQARARRLGGTGDVIGEAIDVSGGTPEDLLAYNQRLARLGGGPVLPDSGGAVASPAAYGGTTTGAPVIGGVPMAGGLDRFGAAEERRTAAAVTPIRNPLSARAALPQGFAFGEEEAGSPLDALLRPDNTDADEDDLVSILERFRPKRRLG